MRPKSQALPARRDVQTQTELRLPSKSMRAAMRSGRSERSEVSLLEDGSPMPFQLKVTKVESGRLCLRQLLLEGKSVEFH